MVHSNPFVDKRVGSR